MNEVIANIVTMNKMNKTVHIYTVQATWKNYLIASQFGESWIFYYKDHNMSYECTCT